MKTAQGFIAFLAFLLIAIAVLLAPVKTGMKDEIELSPVVLKMRPGDSYPLDCRLTSAYPNTTLRFDSSNPSVATVREDGLVSALTSGETLITAISSNGAEKQVQVSVQGIPLSGLTLNASEVHVAKGQYTGLEASFNEDASDQRLIWRSENEKIASVDEYGRIMGISGGQTNVFVYASNGLYDVTRVYVDVPANALRITPEDMIIGVGATVQMQTVFQPADCTETIERWSSQDPDVLQVDESGRIHAVGIGTTRVRAHSAGGISDMVEVTVEAAPVSVQIEPESITLDRGSTIALEILNRTEKGEIVSGTSHPVLWSSSDPGVASVDENGVVQALRSGNCRILAELDGIRSVCKLKVQTVVQTVQLKETERYLLKEQTDTPIQLVWRVLPADADDTSVAFVSNNEQVATVSRDGLVTLTGGYGTAVITATGFGGAYETFTVNVVTELPESEGE